MTSPEVIAAPGLSSVITVANTQTVVTVPSSPFSVITDNSGGDPS